MRKTGFILDLRAAGAAALLACGVLVACSVPVFRYALERWQTDDYELYVFHRGALSPDARAALEWLSACATAPTGRANLVIAAVDIDKPMDPAAEEVWGARKTPSLPWAVLRYPRSAGLPGIAWEGAFGVETARTLVDSPCRREIGRALLGGASAVWVLLESGERARDDGAAATLATLLAKFEKTLELPPMEDMDRAADVDAHVGETAALPPLRVSFALRRVGRADPAEAPLAAMLLGSEKDLRTFTEPIVFPVFGRGRALFALVGAGITEENVGQACEFLAGPCSCQIKAFNPGTDLLMAAAWDECLAEARVESPALPPLTGIGVGSTPEGGDGAAVRDRVLVSALIAGAVLLGFIAGGTLLVLRKR